LSGVVPMISERYDARSKIGIGSDRIRAASRGTGTQQCERSGHKRVLQMSAEHGDNQNITKNCDPGLTLFQLKTNPILIACVLWGVFFL